MKKRLTVNEVKDFDPSFLNPMRVDVAEEYQSTFGPYCYILSKPNLNGVFMYSNHSGSVGVDSLQHINRFLSPSDKKPKFKKVAMYQPLVDYGVRMFEDEYYTWDEILELETVASGNKIVGHKKVMIDMKVSEP